MRTVIFVLLTFLFLIPCYAEDKLADYYSAYIFVKNCNDLDPYFYVDNENFQIAKDSIKNIENDYKKRNESIDVDAEWNKAVINWKEDFESMFSMFKSLDTYSEDIAGMCKLYLLMLNAAGNSLENKNIEKDF
tara:strand:+ start:1750 stop:2148 length:399 start_codon:yes stop_codon:yes gene_type:complete